MKHGGLIALGWYTNSQMEIGGKYLDGLNKLHVVKPVFGELTPRETSTVMDLGMWGSGDGLSFKQGETSLNGYHLVCMEKYGQWM